MPADHRSAVAHHPEFQRYDFGPEHPLRPDRITLGLDLLRSAKLWDPQTESVPVSPARIDELELVHDPAYIRAVQEAGTSWLPAVERRHFGLGPGDNPPFPAIHEAASWVAGGTLQAARMIMRGELEHAFAPAGGLHHASRDQASGFCIYNDPALAAAAVVEEFGGRVLYVDFDCHHGDGVQWIFYRDPRVMTISFHESGRYLFPGTGGVEEVGEGGGRSFAVNVPFAPYTRDESWLAAIHAILPPLVERFSPDIIISAHGADTHVWDPLTHLSLTTLSFAQQARLTHELAHRYAGARWLATGSGGYDWRRVVPRSWAILWSEMSGRPLPRDLPEEWLERWGGDFALPVTYIDDADIRAKAPRREVEQANEETVRRVKALFGLTEAETPLAR